MTKKALSISILSSVPVVVFAYFAQYWALRFAVNYFQLEYLSVLFFTCLALSSITITKLQLDLSLKRYILKVFLPLFVGLFALTITSKLLFQVDLYPLPSFSSLLIFQLGFRIYIVIGCWLLLFVLNRVLWRRSKLILSAKMFVIALVLILFTAFVHSLCIHTSLTVVHDLTQAVLPKYSIIGLLYGVQQGITFLTFVVAAILYPSITPSNSTSPREFMNAADSTDFSLTIYEDYAKTLSPHEQRLIGMIQASGIELGDGRDACITAIQQCFDCCPEVPYDIIVWRGGEMENLNRPYVSAALLKDSAAWYAGDEEKNLHRITVCKGSKIFPLRALSKDYGDGEAEIIIETKRLRKTKTGYLYL